MFVHVNQPSYKELNTVSVNGQRWYITPDNNKYASVTTVLGAKEKPGLDAWRQSLGEKKAKKETERCADRGEKLHEVAENFLKNVENPTKGYDPKIIKLFNQLKFCLKNINNIRAQEIPLYSDKLRIAGRVDCVAEYEGKLSIVDFKTSNNNKYDELVEDYFLQCTAYALMYFELFDVPIDDIVVLIAVEKGMVPMVYKRKIDDYIAPLMERINTFYKGVKQ